MPEILDGADEPVTVEGLEEVVRRAGQRRRATLVAGAAALLAVGGLTGALVRGPVQDRSTGLAADTPAPAPAPVPRPAMAAPVFGDLKEGPGRALTSLFRREANGVAIRAYRMTPTFPEAPNDPKCAPPPLVEVQLSNAAAVSVGGAAETAGDKPAVLGFGEFGQAEGEPASWVVVRPGSATASVRLRSGGASDTMAPQQGVAVLAVPGRASGGTVEALGADGAVLATLPLTGPLVPPMDPSCFPEKCVVGPDGPVAGFATTVPEAPLPPPSAPSPPAAEPATDLPADEKAALAERRKLGKPEVSDGAMACGWAAYPEAVPSVPAPAPGGPGPADAPAPDAPPPAVRVSPVPPTTSAPLPPGFSTTTTAATPASTAAPVPAS